MAPLPIRFDDTHAGDQAVAEGILSYDDLAGIMDDGEWPETSRPLSDREAEAMANLVEISHLTKDVFKDIMKTRFWLRRPTWLLEDRSPIEMASVPGGIEKVREVLVRIAHGFAA